MHSPAHGAKAHLRQVFGRNRKAGRLVETVPLLARALWPRKTAEELSFRTGTSVRACEFVLAGRNGLSGDALLSLIRSPEGFRVLDELLADEPPIWWQSVKRQYELARLKRAVAENRRQIETFENELAGV